MKQFFKSLICLALLFGSMQDLNARNSGCCGIAVLVAAPQIIVITVVRVAH